jgi:predicted SnoaL-like aldol condensation-catalyzing enzyme
MSEENKELMRRFVMDCQSAGDLSLIDEMVSPDFVNHAEVPGLPEGREGVKVLFGALHHAFEGFHAWDVIDIVRIEAGKLVEHWNVVDMTTLLNQISGSP